MKVLAFVSDGKKREQVLAEAIVAGARACGETAEIRVKGDGDEIEPCDLVCFVGVKNRERFRAYEAAGIDYAYFDKGYTRRLLEENVKGGEFLEYWRVSVNSHQPLPFIEKARKSFDRAYAQGHQLMPWRSSGDAIIVDGSSAKHFAFHDLGDPTEVARGIIDQLRGKGRPIIYRPKPSWTGAVPIEGTEFSRGKDYRPAFARAHVLVTYGSNLCFDATLAGVPSIVLGHGVARPISSTSLASLDHPRMASMEERRQWLANVAWCQFKLGEISSGLAWRTMREMLECATSS